MFYIEQQRYGSNPRLGGIVIRSWNGLQAEAEAAGKAAAEPQQEAAPSRGEASGRRSKQTASRSSKRMTRAQVQPTSNCDNASCYGLHVTSGIAWWVGP